MKCLDCEIEVIQVRRTDRKYCKKCYKRHWRQSNAEKCNEIERLRYHSDLEKSREQNKLKRQALRADAIFKARELECSRTYESKPEVKEKRKQWRKLNKGLMNARTAKRRALKLKATPKWADLSKIKEIYKNCPEGYHVDHIIPLQGRNVCGLHVPENLQYLPAFENRRKSNKL